VLGRAFDKAVRRKPLAFAADAGGFWICRSGHPSRPRAKTCCFFSSYKTFAMPSEVTSPRGCKCPGRYSRWPVFR
jgi:hypothetical protein